MDTIALRLRARLWRFALFEQTAREINDTAGALLLSLESRYLDTSRYREFELATGLARASRPSARRLAASLHQSSLKTYACPGRLPSASEDLSLVICVLFTMTDSINLATPFRNGHRAGLPREMRASRPIADG
jgi:hypothetical protein